MSQNLAIKFASREFVVNRGTLNEGHFLEKLWTILHQLVHQTS